MTEILEAEGRFFAALLAGDLDALDQLLTDDFLLIDVMAGSEVEKAALLGFLAEGGLRFTSIERGPARVRAAAHAAIVTGWTRMTIAVGPETHEAHSRYTHVYVPSDDGWRLMSAQGTRIAG